MATAPHELPRSGGVLSTATRRVRHKHHRPSESRQQQSTLDATTVSNGGAAAVCDGADPTPHQRGGGRPGINTSAATWAPRSGWTLAICGRSWRYFSFVHSVRPGGLMKGSLLMMLGIALATTVVQCRNVTRTEAYLQNGWGGHWPSAGLDSDEARSSFPRVVSHYAVTRKGGDGRLTGVDGMFFERLDEPVDRLHVSNGSAHVASTVGYNAYRKMGRRKIHISQEERNHFVNLRNSKRYQSRMRDKVLDRDCVPMHSWQETSFPSCNTVHEIIEDATTLSFLLRGGYNDVFKFQVGDGVNGATSFVLKALKGPNHFEFSDSNFDTVRRDALIMERSTSSPYVMDIYGYCGIAQITKYTHEGDLFQAFWRWHRRRDTIDQQSKLRLAAQVANGLSAVHNIDGEGTPSMSHGDLATKQYMKVGEVYKLNDFNRGRFITWNKKQEKPCTYTLHHDVEGAWRSPEEYKKEALSSKIDIWALGSIFFEILTWSKVWAGFDESQARRLLIQGKLPPVKDEIRNSTDPIDQVLLKAIDMCYVYEPEKRPSAKEVSDYINTEAQKLGVQVGATQF